MRAIVLVVSFSFMAFLSAFGLTCEESVQQNAVKVTEASAAEDLVENATFSTSIKIQYAGTSATVSSLPAGITANISNGDVVITSSLKDVEYVLSGTTTDGSVKIYSDSKFKLTLDGVNITNKKGPAINIQSGKRAFIVLKDGTTNKLVDGQSYTPHASEDMKACLFSEGQLIFSGKGSLSVQGNHQHAICSDDYVRIRDGAKITVASAVKDGIHVNEYLVMDGGNVAITTSNDGIDVEKGDIEIKGGSLKIATSGDAAKGIKGKADLIITGGTIDIATTGNAVQENNDISSPVCVKITGNVRISGKDTKVTLASSGTAGKGISCDKDFVFSDATINVTTTGGQYMISRSLSSSAKAIKSKGDVTVNSGTMKLVAQNGAESEGLESKNILTINGGDIDVYAYDDAINASRAVVINGGNMRFFSATGDGIDSNGTITVTGGTVFTIGAGGPEEGFDCDRNTFTITGGLLVGTGGRTTMPTANVTTQQVMVWGADVTKEELVNIQTADGKNILTYSIPRIYNQMTMLFSSPELKQNAEYVISRGGKISGAKEVVTGLYSGGTYSGGTKESSFTQESAITSVGQVFSGFGGRGGFGGGGRGRGMW
ncbi:carbohydrate-binding domain-containing protein [Parabacteroides sp. OttesenSCG-928-G07]|nr:carbohydrate-binding domain-containing protein [Parabacteroides sp. OttesenSCG-928-G07]